MRVSIRTSGGDVIRREFKLRPSQIRRAAKKTVRVVVNEIHRELGGDIPRAAGVRVLGFRRVRAKKKTPKGRAGNVSGSVWMGTRNIDARYAGRLRNDRPRGGAWAGKHFFDNAFVAKMKSGYIGIFEKRDGGIKKVTVDLPFASGQAEGSVRRRRKHMLALLDKNIEKETARRRR